MKRIALLFTLLATSVLFAQTTGFNYKALISDNGNILANQSINIRFTVLENGATAVYQETQTATTDNNGIVNVNIGEGTIISGDFNTINWANSQYLKVEIDTGNGYLDFGTNPLKYVPAAKYADTAGNVFSGNFNDLSNVPAGLADGDDDTHLTDAEIAAMGYIKNPDDADHDTTNELQNLSLTGTQLSISNANHVDFTGWDTDTTDDFSGNYIDLNGKPVLRDTINAVLDTTTQFVRHETQNLSDVLSKGNSGGNVQIKNIAEPTDSTDVVTLSYLKKYTHGEAQDNRLVLWNKLGSDAEVLNSEIGENGALVGSGNNYEPAKFGNGYVRTNTSSYVKFPSSVLEARRTSGTIEFWVNPKVDQPSAFHYGAFMLVGYSISGSEALAFIRWGDGVTGLGISGGVNFDGTIHKTPEEAQQFVATVGTPFHIALVWDVNGIDGTNETIRVYRDGTVIGVSTETWNDNTSTTYDHFYIGTGPDGQGFDKYIMDNIKVWNYAKTDFSDINEESGTSPLYTAGDGIDITDNVISIKKYHVGDFAQGGIVFWVDETGEHGLVCAKQDQSSGTRWYAGTYGDTQAKGDGLYAGKPNTTIIIAAQVAIGDDGSNYAARMCNELQITEGGETYGDWYLPSKEELNLMYQNKGLIDATAEANGGSSFDSSYYWSSTEIGMLHVWVCIFNDGTWEMREKNITSYRVRAIRSF